MQCNVMSILISLLSNYMWYWVLKYIFSYD